MKAIIPAAGYATRLYPLTVTTPKPLLSIAGKPIINYIIQKILELGVVDHIYVVTNAKFYQQFQAWQASMSCPIPITIINDGTLSNEDRLGAIGDKLLVLTTANIDDEVLDISGDNLFNFSLKDMYSFFKKRKAETIGLFDVKDKETAKRMGICSISPDNVITHFVEKPAEPPSTLTSIGVYMYPRRTIALFKKYIEGGNKPDQPGLFLQWLYPQQRIYGYIFDKPGDIWYDIGNIDQYRQADATWQQLL